MTKKAKLTIYSIIAAATFANLVAIKLSKLNPNITNSYEVMNTFNPVIGGILGLLTSMKFSGRKSKLGQGIIFISAGLIMWGLGQSAWTYYNIFGGVAVPYPSWADFGYLSAIPLWFIGVFKLTSAMGVKFGLKSNFGKVAIIAIPLASFALSYYLQIVVARGGWPDHNNINIKLFTDLAYPFGDVAVVTIVLTAFGLSTKYLGGRFKRPAISIMAGFILMYISDFSLTYTTTKGTYYNGCWVDYFYTFALIFIAMGMILLDPSDAKAVVSKAPKQENNNQLKGPVIA